MTWHYRYSEDNAWLSLDQAAELLHISLASLLQTMEALTLEDHSMKYISEYSTEHISPIRVLDLAIDYFLNEEVAEIAVQIMTIAEQADNEILAELTSRDIGEWLVQYAKTSMPFDNEQTKYDMTHHDKVVFSF